MKYSSAVVLFHLCTTLYAQTLETPLGSIPDSSLTCQNGASPRVTCDHDSPDDSNCSCRCTNGINLDRPFTYFLGANGTTDGSDLASQIAACTLREKDLSSQIQTHSAREKNAVDQLNSCIIREKDSSSLAETCAAREKRTIDQLDACIIREKDSISQVEICAAHEKRAADQLAACKKESSSQVEICASREKRAVDQLAACTLREKDSTSQAEICAAREKRVADQLTACKKDSSSQVEIYAAREKRAVEQLDSCNARGNDLNSKLGSCTARGNDLDGKLMSCTARGNDLDGKLGACAAREKDLDGKLGSCAAREKELLAKLDVSVAREKAFDDQLKAVKLLTVLHALKKTEMKSQIAKYEGKPLPYMYRGCYPDTAARILNSASKTGYYAMTIDHCATYCKGFKYFGTRDGDGCYCGKQLEVAAAAAEECDWPCKGDNLEMCGAKMRLSVYENIKV